MRVVASSVAAAVSENGRSRVTSIRIATFEISVLVYPIRRAETVYVPGGMLMMK
jgi:hypothetical protein